MHKSDKLPQPLGCPPAPAGRASRGVPGCMGRQRAAAGLTGPAEWLPPLLPFGGCLGVKLSTPTCAVAHECILWASSVHIMPASAWMRQELELPRNRHSQCCEGAGSRPPRPAACHVACGPPSPAPDPLLTKWERSEWLLPSMCFLMLGKVGLKGSSGCLPGRGAGCLGLTPVADSGSLPGLSPSSLGFLTSWVSHVTCPADLTAQSAVLGQASATASLP